MCCGSEHTGPVLQERTDKLELQHALHGLADADKAQMLSMYEVEL